MQIAERTLQLIDMIWGSIGVQLVKLGCSQNISTPWFLVTDADTFFMRKVQALDLVRQSDCNETSGVCDLKQKVVPCLLPHDLIL